MGVFWTAGWSGQVDFLENAIVYQHHLRRVYVGPLARQLMLYGNETSLRVLTLGEIFGFVKGCSVLFFCSVLFCFQKALFFETLMYILMCYSNVLYLLS